MKILVCGGAGYIGSHMVRFLLKHDHDVVVLDNLSTGHAASVPAELLNVGDLMDLSALRSVFASHAFDGVIHFCARSLVGESILQPYAYYENNVVGTLNLLKVMQEAAVHKLVFSSTAAVFGNPEADLIDEEHRTQPINPYGASKLMVERILADAAKAYGLRSVALRYFNAAGADFEGGIGESHHPETHLIPNVLNAALGEGKNLKVFGNNYPTKDGTCVRDYIHVNDLASAHLLALHFMKDHDGFHAFNLGNGNGFSVMEVIAAAEKMLGKKIEFIQEGRRDGDPATLVASSKKASEWLGWNPNFKNINDIIASAWQWHKAAAY